MSKPRFTLRYYSQEAGTDRDLSDFRLFLIDKLPQSEWQRLWDENRIAFADDLDGFLPGLLLGLAQCYCEWLFHGAVLPPTDDDPNWQYYRGLITARFPALDPDRHSVSDFQQMCDRHINYLALRSVDHTERLFKLLQMSKDDRCLEYMKKHYFEFDVNRVIWTVIALNRFRRIVPFRFMLESFGSALRILNVNGRPKISMIKGDDECKKEEGQWSFSVWTPYSFAADNHASGILSVVSAYGQGSQSREPDDCARESAKCQGFCDQFLYYMKHQVCQHLDDYRISPLLISEKIDVFEQCMEVLKLTCIAMIKDEKRVDRTLFTLVQRWQECSDPVTKGEEVMQSEEEEQRESSKVVIEGATSMSDFTLSSSGGGSGSVSSSADKIKSDSPMVITRLPSRSLWMTLRQKLSNMLDFRTLSEKPLQWKFVESTLLNAKDCLPCVISNPECWSEILEMCKQANRQKSDTLKREMSVLIANEELSFVDLCSLDASSVQECYSSRDQWRQDAVPFGVQSSIDEEHLKWISLHSSSFSFDARQTYDSKAYLSELLCTAHIVDPLFRDRMDDFKDTLNRMSKNPVDMKFGPVKGYERCVSKSEENVKEIGAVFPASASIIDLVRCSLTFTTIEDCVIAVREFVDHWCVDDLQSYVKAKEESKEAESLEMIMKHSDDHVSGDLDDWKETETKKRLRQKDLLDNDDAPKEDDESSSLKRSGDSKSDDDRCLFQIMRMKNGFRKYLATNVGGEVDEAEAEAEAAEGGKGKLQFEITIPESYSDIKINVIVNVKDPFTSGLRRSIVGEIQFLLQPILKSKQIGHQIYEIERYTDFINDSKKYYNENYHINCISKQMERASKSSEMSLILYDFNYYITPQMLLFRNEHDIKKDDHHCYQVSLLQRILVAPSIKESLVFYALDLCLKSSKLIISDDYSLIKQAFNEETLATFALQRANLNIESMQRLLKKLQMIIGMEEYDRQLRIYPSGFQQVALMQLVFERVKSVNVSLLKMFVPSDLNHFESTTLEKQSSFWMKDCLDGRFGMNIVHLAMKMDLSQSRSAKRECFDRVRCVKSLVNNDELYEMMLRHCDFDGDIPFTWALSLRIKDFAETPDHWEYLHPEMEHLLLTDSMIDDSELWAKLFEFDSVKPLIPIIEGILDRRRSSMMMMMDEEEGGEGIPKEGDVPT